MEALLFLGCTVPVRNLNYELSARKVAEALDITLKDLPEFGCCGFPLKANDQRAALIIAARALAQAGETGLPLVALCSACTGTLSEAAHLLDHNEETRDEVNQKLKPLGLEYKPGVNVKHFARFLYEDVGVDALKKTFTQKLDSFTFAPHYGCHYLKPSEVTGKFDDPENPVTLTRLIEATGAKSLNYSSMKDCCGGGLLGTDENLAGSMAGQKLMELGHTEVTALAVICPFCNVMYEGQQKSILKKKEADFKVPVVYLTQILGLAMGYSPNDLGFKLNRVKPKDLVKAFK
ncbi:CoB--CoM heterodisulfide reductase iron-sulfur subunit B family protein [Dethiosulfatarculus sandiegensis]|uniref:Cysteine-rich domain-containing protein n=1 Tax=Dethiosulfatarculus sandiegensis TaxID=1429043 RepID=A0A0D2JF95_9BACT|nr:CoB--CoM heterodisulfide reductase iron-sulfur subunit B family protein [Dethiosulfatarculus sandiegensis]KIX14376.1 hypothetical protein X474_09195 [Dethiosulfatarculus sandiegensis]